MMGEWIEKNIPEEGGKSPLPNENGRLSQLTLNEAGIDYHDSPKFRILAINYLIAIVRPLTNRRNVRKR